MKELEKDVQGVIVDLQNPKSCASAKKLVCALNKGNKLFPELIPESEGFVQTS